MTYDLVVRGGTVVTSVDTYEADLGVVGEQIATIGKNLPKGQTEIDARGKLVMPGGVDTHAHLEQLSASGLMTADDFESGTRAAAFGGTTTILSFAAQHIGMKVPDVVADYHAAAKRGAVIDYGFHIILADPTPEALDSIPGLIKAGHASLKVFTTYDRLKLDDEKMLDVLAVARANKALVCVHAENHGMIAWLTKRLLDRGYTHPRYHAVAHAAASEAEAFRRVIALSELIDQPVMIYHVSTAEGAGVIKDARGRGVKIFAETCPHYLFMERFELDRPGLEGAKYLCSPPLRNAEDREALWQALDHGDLQVISSDHAPYAFDANGKLKFGPNATFKQIGSGLPGVEVRLPLMFDAMVSKGRLGANRFVDLTSTTPAKLYGLHPRKGTIAIGTDADLVIWDPVRSQILSASVTHDRTGYTPYEGRTLTGWPETVVLRGRPLVRDGKIDAIPGSGRFLAREGGSAAVPAGRLSASFDPEQNFGAKLY